MRFATVCLTITLTLALLMGTVMGQTTGPAELAQLNKTTPGAAQLTAWFADGTAVALPDPGRDGAMVIPDGAAAIGVIWPVRHVVDGVTLSGLAQVGEVQLQVHDGRRWLAWPAQLQQHDSEVRMSFAPVATDRLRVSLRDSRITGIQVYPYWPAAGTDGGVAWPDLVTTTRLQQQLLESKDEPSFEVLGLHGLSMPIWATMGLKDGAGEQAVWWDGQIHAAGGRLLVRVGRQPIYLAQVRDTLRRELIDGYLPGIVTRAQVGPIELRQTTFTVSVGQTPALWLRVELRNTSTQRWQDELGIEARNRPNDKVNHRWAWSGGILSRDDRAYVLTNSGSSFVAPSTITMPLALEPGQSLAVDLVVPIGLVSADQAGELIKMSYDQALTQFRTYWAGILALAMKIDVPEARLNNMYRSILAQLFINAEGDLMPYGCEPSAYDNAFYGVEEGYAMLALGMFGFGPDAQRYMDATYLTSAFLAKVPEHKTYEDRHQQYRNGLSPMYAIELYRLTHDKVWIGKHTDLFNQCAQWTIAARRSTMDQEDGKRPLHYGLLPKWSYGGDIADEMCYPFYSNFACWRGMQDTAWLMNDLGNKELADRYAQEAKDYYQTLMNVVDAVYEKDRTPPCLPPHVYAKGPAGEEYYQLFAGCILDLLPFEFADRRADYIGNFLVADNREFCLLPRFRRDAGPGGLDALYGMGRVLTCLHQDRINEFLLGFYAFQAFNLEHTCFSSRETNAIYSSDLHLRTEFKVPAMSDPLPCSSAVSLIFLRHLLLTEQTKGAGQFTGTLLLLPAAPRRWLADGQRITVADAPTHFGKVSYEVRSQLSSGRITAEIRMPDKSECQAVTLRLRHPDGKAPKALTINGRDSEIETVKNEYIEIAHPAGAYVIEVRY